MMCIPFFIHKWDLIVCYQFLLPLLSSLFTYWYQVSLYVNLTYIVRLGGHAILFLCNVLICGISFLFLYCAFSPSSTAIEFDYENKTLIHLQVPKKRIGLSQIDLFVLALYTQGFPKVGQHTKPLRIIMRRQLFHYCLFREEM